MVSKVIYLIGSLRNPEIPALASYLRHTIPDSEIFDDWMAAGELADDAWRDYEKSRGHTYAQALQGYPAKHVFTFDEFNLNRAHAGILVYPAGKSGHLELGYLAGQNKPTFILLDEIPERYDVMKQFAKQGIFTTKESLADAINNYRWPKLPTMPLLYQHEVLWLAGLLEGEGSFCISGAIPRLVLQMTDKDIVDMAASILDSKVWGGSRKTKGNKFVWACGASGLKAIEWMRVLSPYLGIRRNQQIKNTVAHWLDRRTQRRQDNQFWAQLFHL